MEQFQKRAELMAIVTLFVLVLALPSIVHGQYFAKTSKSLPRLGRRVDPAMYDLMGGGFVKSQLSSPIMNLYKELDANGDRCLTLDEFRDIVDSSSAASIAAAAAASQSDIPLKETSSGNRGGKKEDQIFNRILSALDDK